MQGVWRNIHTKDMATITDEPLIEVYELTYAEKDKQLYDEDNRKCRWTKELLLKNWRPVMTIIEDLESEEE